MNKHKLREQLIRDEGIRRLPYLDTVGKTTIGCGRNLTDVGVSLATIEQMLDEDIEKCVRTLDGGYPWYSSLNDARKAVAINIVFNVGPAGFAKFRHFNAALVAKNYIKAAAEIRDSGIAPNRKERLAVQMETGLWDGKAPPRTQAGDVTGPVPAGEQD